MPTCQTNHCGRRVQRKFGREKLVIEKKGKLLAVAWRNCPPPPATEKQRGTITNFSRASRLRLLKLIATIDWGLIPSSLFVTLTYPDDTRWDDPNERTKQKYLFHRAMETHLGRNICGVWRIEWKPRKSGPCRGMFVPHYHFLLLGVGYIDHRWIRYYWMKAIDWKGKVATDVKACRSAKKAALYVSKYVAKTHDPHSLDNGAYSNSNGRHWGYFRKPEIPLHFSEIIDNVTNDEWDWLRQRANGLLRWRLPEDDNGFVLLGNISDFVWTEFLTFRLAERIE